MLKYESQLHPSCEMMISKVGKKKCGKAVLLRCEKQLLQLIGFDMSIVVCLDYIPIIASMFHDGVLYDKLCELAVEYCNGIVEEEQ